MKIGDLVTPTQVLIGAESNFPYGIENISTDTLGLILDINESQNPIAKSTMYKVHFLFRDGILWWVQENEIQVISKKGD